MMHRAGQIRFRIEYGFDVLIAKYTEHGSCASTPAEWREELQKHD